LPFREAAFSAFPEQDRHEFEHNFGRLADPDSLPDEAAQRRERTALVRSCIEALPAKQQQVIYLRFYVDDSLGGIAAALGCSVGTVKSRLFHALDKLRGMNALSEQRENPKEEV
jgi:RNA polymerase sigma-70 factor, ECF subfamily